MVSDPVVQLCRQRLLALKREGEGHGKLVNVKNCRVCFSKILKAILGLEL